MCRSIKTLYNYEPPATEEEVVSAARQYVRKISGYQTPSAANEAAFQKAVVDVASVTRALIDSLVTRAPSRSREAEEAKRKELAKARFG